MDCDARAMPPIQRLIFFIAQDTTDEMVSRFREFVIGLKVRRSWLINAPYVENIGDTIGSRSELAGVLEIYSAIPPSQLPKDIDAVHLDEVTALIKAIEEFSREYRLEFELEIDGKFVGAIDSGEPDKALRYGLLEEWKKQLSR